MATRKQSKGTCAYCGKEMSKAGISKHLQTCVERQAAIAKAEQVPGSREQLYHLRVQDAYNPAFGLDLEMRGSQSLKDLDFYLREIWLDCCGHMSEFSAGGFMHTVRKARKLSDVFPYGECELLHVYDYTHPHKNYGDPLPLMNSPRTGMCGYTGPATPPY